MGNIEPNRVFVFGNNEDNQLGHISKERFEKSPILLQEPKDVIVRQISAGGHHTAILAEMPNSTFQVYTCGNGYSGQLGHGLLESSPTPKRVDALMNKKIRQIACGAYHTLALTIEGEVYSWGRGQDGQLGHGNLVQSLTPRKIEALSNTGIIKIAAGESHSAAIAYSGEVYTWGGGLSNFLGHKQHKKRPIPHMIPKFNNKGAIAIECGSQHTVLLCSNGQVYSWGQCSDGQLGHGDTKFVKYPQVIEKLRDENVYQISCGQHHTAVVTIDGRLFTFGLNDCGQLGHTEPTSVNKPLQVTSLSTFHCVSVSCGFSHTLVLTKDGYVFSFGSDGNGQLGRTRKKQPRVPKPIPKLEQTMIRQVVCGNEFSFVLSSNAIHDPLKIPTDARRPDSALYENQQIAEKQKIENVYRISKTKLTFIDLSLDDESYSDQSSSSDDELEYNNQNIIEKSKKKKGKNQNSKDSEETTDSEDSDDEPPECFICPITFEIMIDPVIAIDGYTYEREAIESWFEKNKISPMTGKELISIKLIPNNSLKNQIQNSKWSEF
ncbi:regulator of chromosome condensation protein [Anaeramoeba flamelloides]|uniref:Regulator of chromosome condensation protein n=1 Tax=Anaeramoeba flamelloides TaxID=1746091 RepID=A0ABQ8X562_9EUKA|nr:regulator of chromosome condensation protein [Anaeramoeba flamelloides]